MNIQASHTKEETNPLSTNIVSDARREPVDNCMYLRYKTPLYKILRNQHAGRLLHVEIGNYASTYGIRNCW